jgi:hypothetical protein
MTLIGADGGPWRRATLHLPLSIRSLSHRLGCIPVEPLQSQPVHGEFLLTLQLADRKVRCNGVLSEKRNTSVLKRLLGNNSSTVHPAAFGV